MARRFRVWVKKQGSRTTSARRVGQWGETAFFAAWFLLGLSSLIYLLFAPTFFDEQTPWQLGGGRWLVLLVVTSFILLGGRGLAVSLLQMRTSRERRSALAHNAAKLAALPEHDDDATALPGIPRGINLTNSPGIRLAYRLPMSHSGAWEMLAATSFCLVWNALTLFLIREVWVGYRQGQPTPLAAVAILPFMAIGVWAIRFFILQLVRQTRVGPTLVEISDQPLQTGQPFTCYVSQSGSVRLQELAVHLVCEEETTCHQGTDIRFDRQVVYNETIIERRPVELRSGQPLEVETASRIPAGMMHSFHSPHNAITWKLVVRGTLERGGGTFEHPFPMVVIPETNSVTAHGSAH